MIDTKKCLICNKGKRNDVLHWHIDEDSKNIWCWCCKCDKARTVWQYCEEAKIKLSDFLKGDFDFIETNKNEVNRMDWPINFISLNDPRAKDGTEYIKSRGLSLIGDMYYDLKYKGIVFPYYFDNIFCGAQVRLLEPIINEDGDEQKITTVPGTRLSLLIYGYNQLNIMPHIKGFIITEGAFNALSIQQSLDKIYGGAYKSPLKTVACSGSGASEHQIQLFKDLKDKGYKIICSPDKDEAGLKMFKKYINNNAISHYCLTDTEKDWNDELIDLGNKEFANYFLKRIKKI